MKYYRKFKGDTTHEEITDKLYKQRAEENGWDSEMSEFSTAFAFYWSEEE